MKKSDTIGYSVAALIFSLIVGLYAIVFPLFGLDNCNPAYPTFFCASYMPLFWTSMILTYVVGITGLFLSKVRMLSFAWALVLGIIGFIFIIEILSLP